MTSADFISNNSAWLLKMDQNFYSQNKTPGNERSSTVEFIKELDTDGPWISTRCCVIACHSHQSRMIRLVSTLSRKFHLWQSLKTEQIGHILNKKGFQSEMISENHKEWFCRICWDDRFPCNDIKYYVNMIQSVALPQYLVVNSEEKVSLLPGRNISQKVKKI